MRSIKNICNLKPSNLYGGKFRVADYENEFGVEYLIERIPEIPDGHDESYYGDINDKEHCWISWVQDGKVSGTSFSWGTVIGNIKDGTWILI